MQRKVRFANRRISDFCPGRRLLRRTAAIVRDRCLLRRTSDFCPRRRLLCGIAGFCPGSLLFVSDESEGILARGATLTQDGNHFTILMKAEQSFYKFTY